MHCSKSYEIVYNELLSLRFSKSASVLLFRCDKEPVLLSPIVLIPFLAKSPFETLWYKQFPSPKNWTGSYRVLCVPSKKMFLVWCTCSYLLILKVKHVFHVSRRQNQVNFLVCQKEAKKIGSAKEKYCFILRVGILKQYFAYQAQKKNQQFIIYYNINKCFLVWVIFFK